MHVKGGAFAVILSSPLVRTFFAPTVGVIRSCLDDIRRSLRALVSLDYVILVGGFSASPLVETAIRRELDGSGCVVKTLLRPDIAVLKGSVIASDSLIGFDSPPSDLPSIMLF